MHPGPAQRAVALLTLATFLSACATTQLPPISAAGPGFEPLPDERALWAAARDEEERLLEEVRVYEDPLLVDYLEDLVADLNPPSMAANREVRYRVTVVEDPTLNAFAYPHGSVFVHTGLLARMENEAQLATVLGHEMTHVENRHMIRHHRAVRNRQIALTAVAVAAAVVVAGEAGEAIEQGNYSRAARIELLSDVLLSLGLTLAFVASVNGYGRSLEEEADRGGFVKLTAAGYDPAEAPKVYQALMEDHGDSGKLEAFFFGSHPQLARRVEGARAWLAARPPAPDEEAPPTLGDEERFARRIRPVVRDDARLNLELGRLELAEAELDKVLDWMPEDPEAWLLRARLRLAQGDVEQDPAAREVLRGEAKDALYEAIRLDADRPAPHRELGLMLYREGDRGGACRELGHYLELAPEAEDAPRMRDYRLELEQAGECG
ncbi:MAG TPA: M48 family metalloprotease [Thermoanaerobaculia bacterium]